ncbi:MAG: hypothetical protein M9891_05410 [Austwickia sp.]|nr:hypothetical protein [Austwickia sp.]
MRRHEPDDPAASELIRMVRADLRAPTPVDFLVTGTMLAATGLAYEDPDTSDWVGFVDSFLLTDIAETTAVLHVVAAITPDAVLQARIRRELANRRQPMPTTVSGLPGLRVRDAMVLADEFGASDNYLLGLAWPQGDQLTFVVYVDHTLGTVVKDAFLTPEPLESTVARFEDLMAQSGEPVNFPTRTDVADCRARIEQALARLDESPYAGHEADWHDNEEVSMWPACRAFLDFVLSRMPSGGEGYADLGDIAEFDDVVEFAGEDVRQAFEEAVFEAFEQFAESPEARTFQENVDEEHSLASSAAAASLLSYAAAQTGDPLEWTPETVGVALLEGLAPNPLLSELALDLSLEVLQALIRYAHRLRDIDPDARAATLAAVERHRPAFAELRADPAVMAQRRLLAPGGLQDAGPAAALQVMMQERLEELAGGAAALAELDVLPLPDADLDLRGIPADIHLTLREVSEHVDRLVASGDFPALDIEFRTACRRFLTAVAQSDPGVFRRRAKTVNTAAAVAWTVGRANELVGYLPAPVGTGALMDWLGVASVPSSRAETMLRAFGAVESPWPGVALGSTDVLVSGMRKQLILRRDTGRWGE